MPLDAGGLSDLDEPAAAGGDAARMETYEPSIQSGGDIGEALRALREFRGLSIDALAEVTRVRPAYIAALESMRLDGLPSRPFVIGYIRAMAQALGADADAAAERFKAEEPVLDEPLPEPVGVRDEKDPRLGAMAALGFVIIAAIVGWNIVERVMTESAAAPPTASASVSEKALANTTSGPVTLGAPLPAPVESTTPPPYETPGLDKAVNAQGQPLVPPQDDVAPPSPDLGLAPTFQPRGRIYGAPAGQAAPLVVQALKPGFLALRGSDGSVYFAHQMVEGEAFRVPAVGGLTLDVSDPGAFQLFVNGQSKGVLTDPLTDVSKVMSGIPAPPKPAAPRPAGPPAALMRAEARPATAKTAELQNVTAKAAAAKPPATKAAGAGRSEPRRTDLDQVQSRLTGSKAKPAEAKRPAAIKPASSLAATKAATKTDTPPF